MSKEIVLDLIKKSENPVGIAEVTKLSGLDKDVVAKAINQLKKEELIVSPVRCKYSAK